MKKHLYAIIIVAFFLRVIALNQHDFWFDEAFTYHSSKISIPDIFKIVLTDNNPPLYYLLMHFVINVSTNEIFLRIPSLISSILTIFVIYLFLKKHLNQKVALLASMLIACSPLAIYLATEARPHSLAVFLLVLMILSFFELIKKPDFKRKLLFVAATTIGLYTQYYLALLLLPFTIIIIFQKSPLNIKAWIPIVSSSLILFSPWLILWTRINHNACWCPSSFISLPATIVSPVTSGIGIVTLRYFPQLPAAMLIFSTAAVALTLFIFLRGLKISPALSLLYMAPLAILTAVGAFIPIFSPKAFSVFYPVFFALVAIGINSLKKSQVITLVLLLALSTISVFQSQLPFFKGERLKEVYSSVQTGSYPVVHTSSITYYPLKYYARESIQPNILLVKSPLNSQTVKLLGEGEQSVVPQTENLWLVDTTKLTDKKDRQEAITQLLTNYYQVKTSQFDNISVSLLARRPVTNIQ